MAEKHPNDLDRDRSEPGRRPARPAARPSNRRPAGPSGRGTGRKPALPPGKGASGGKQEKTETRLEDIKAQSAGLRGDVDAQLAAPTARFDEAGKQVLKFHGIYQQDDRDRRSQGKHYQFMVRTKLPGGRLTADQYLVHEALGDRYGNGTVRITTRQGLQLHGVVKGDLHATLGEINEALATTLGACGDVVRNVMCCPAARRDPLRAEIERITHRLADHFTPRTRAYHDVWLDGEKVHDGRAHVETEEPIYGETYLPRKFKIGVASPGDNCIDVYTQDVGLVAVAEEGTLRGFNVLVGGGLGMTHKKPGTFPRLADPFTFVAPDDVLPLVEAVVGVQRDHGDRTDRRHARMKYLIHDWGLPRFRRAVEERLGRPLGAPVETGPLDLDLHLGWHEQGDGRCYVGVSVENGRIQDTAGHRLKTALHEVVTRFRPDVRLTPNHDVLLAGLRAEDRADVDAILRAHGVRAGAALSNARALSMACPALPTCGLAITESERVMPDVIDALEAELDALGLGDERLTIRMTGCPNGCARPYVADLGFVGRSLDAYTVFVGGRPDGTRLNEPYADLVPLDGLVDTVRPLLALFARERSGGESFGDFCHRVGLDALHRHAKNAEDHAYAS